MPLIQPSTRKYWQEAKAKPGFTFFDRLHGYVYARWTYLYIGLGTGRHPLAKKLGPPITKIAEKLILWFGKEQKEGSAPHSEQITFADTYHGKVLPLQAAKELVLVNEEINLPDLEKVIPYARAREIVLQNPDHIVVLDCPCRVARENPCTPIDVCLVIGEPFASFVIDHHPERSRWITPDEAVAIIQAEDERGHVHHAFFKDAMLGRYYAICNCCSCCCGAIQAHQHGTPMLASSGYLAQVNADDCIGCAVCADYCQFDALVLTEDVMAVDQDACMGCGVCVSHCPQDALSLVHDAAKGEPLEIHTLMNTALRS
jgi:Pyruvate/2-oxoacid:ferredoxin oxidoreductase delta subunit